ncbi:MAG: hypothetical protein M3270_05140 [Thermoproteota archaeon]|nr:hypothetical protein [Thermoproteota archaeon]
MNPHSGIDNNSKKNRTKAIAVAIPMAGIVVAAALLSGLSLISFPSAMAQNMTAGGNATTTSPTTAGGGATAGGSACTPAQTGNMTGASTANMTGNATTSTAGGNATTSSPAQLIEQACIAAQNNDTQGVLMNLNMALNALSSNTTTTEGAEDGGDDTDEGGDDTDEGGDTDDSGEEGED